MTDFAVPAWRSSSLADDLAAASVFDVYDELLVPLVFQVYADDLADRLADSPSRGSVLVVAAGTGVVTRVLAGACPPRVAITATDLVPGMVDRAALRRDVAARDLATAPTPLSLPYDDAAFDVVVCQFGAMFFPEGRPRSRRRRGSCARAVGSCSRVGPHRAATTSRPPSPTRCSDAVPRRPAGVPRPRCRTRTTTPT